MRRTRLAAAAGVAALTLGATVAGATGTTDDDTQTVTIEVKALERSVTAAGSAAISIVAGAAPSTASVESTATIAYTNGPDDGEALITAAITKVGNTIGSEFSTAVERGVLFSRFGASTGIAVSLAASAALGPEFVRDLADTTLTPSNSSDDSPLEFGDVLAKIPANVSRAPQPVAYTLAGAPPVTVQTTDLTVTFTIGD